MKSLILLLFLGVTVALAEVQVNNDPYRKPHRPGPVVKQCMEKCGIKRPTMPGKLADEENDPRRHPSLPPDKRKCMYECLKEHRPSKLPPPPTEPEKVADVENDPNDPTPSFGPERIKCLKICVEGYMPSNIPEELADEEIDPDFANPTTPRPTFPPAVEKCIEDCLHQEGR